MRRSPLRCRGTSLRTSRPKTSPSRPCRRASRSLATCTRESTRRCATCACCSSGSSARRQKAWAKRLTRRTSRRCPASRRGYSRPALRRSEEFLDRKVVGPARRTYLAPRALIRILVRAEADELRPVPKAELLELVEAHLDDELRLERLFLELAGAPAIWLGEPPVVLRVQKGQHEGGDLVLALRADRSRADVVEMAVVVVEPEEKRRDRALRALLEADAGDHAVRGLVRLDLHHTVTRAGQVRQSEALRDDAVEACGLQRLQPVAGLRWVVAHRREVDPLRDLLELLAALLDRLVVDRLALPEQEVERDERRGDLGRELAHPALGRVEAHLHRVEVELALPGDDDLPVEGRVRRQQFADLPKLREVAKQRAAVPRPQGQLAAVVLQDPPEPVPLRLVAPTALLRHVGDELGLHGREGNVRSWRIGHGRASLSTMKWIAALVLLVAIAGCGGGGKSGSQPAFLTGVGANDASVTFEFRGEPRDVNARYAARRELMECGSGAPVPLKGSAYAVVHFRPAQTASVADDGKLTLTYTGPRRLQ